MKMIILEDEKGFRKGVVVLQFPPVYRIAEVPKIEAYLNDHSVFVPQQTIKELTFYPVGKPEDVVGTQVMLYKSN